MLKKISFTPDNHQYDLLESLNKEITKFELSLNFVKELYAKLEIRRMDQLISLPLETILGFNEYKAKDIHYLLDFALSCGISFGSLPDWYAEAMRNDERAKTLRFLYSKFHDVRWPFHAPSFPKEGYHFLKANGIERVYQLLLMDNRMLSEEPARLKNKILNGLEYFVHWNDLKNLIVAIEAQDQVPPLEKQVVKRSESQLDQAGSLVSMATTDVV